jgi:hypothetical protein
MKYERFLIVAVISVIIVLSHCSKTWAQSSYVYIDQVGNNNQITITQDGTGHLVAVAIGATLPTNSNDLKTGYGIGTTPYNGMGASEYNNITINQQGVGSHKTTIELPVASNNLINLDQSGAGNHTFNLTATSNTNNINNTINSTQSGTGDKSFALTLDGTNGAAVTIQQTNPTQANTGAMTIQCTTCGAYSYIRQ